MGSDAERSPQHIEPRRVTFHDERTRRMMEIEQRTQYFAATLPPLPIPEEGYDLTPISFDKSYADDGATALLFLDDFGAKETHGKGTEIRTVIFVQPRTIQILDALHLPYVNHAAIESPQG